MKTIISILLYTASLDEEKRSELRITQLAHGRVIPDYSSAYSMRCHSLFEGVSSHKILSVGGPVFDDSVDGVAFQFRSILLTGLSIIRGNRSFEIMLSRRRFLRRKFINFANREIERSNVIVFEGPWHFRTFQHKLSDKIVIYDAHNVEFNLRKNNIYSKEAREIEGEVAKRADAIFCVTKEDMNDFSRIYSVPEGKLFLLPHYQIKVGKIWNRPESKDAVFIGSVYSPNINALNSVKRMAKELTDVNFHVLGNFPRLYRRGAPENVIFDGEVSDSKKEDVICNSFVALNPVEEGGGRNLKMIDYIAHGIPTVSTKIGCRGLYEYGIEKIIDICEPEQFAEKIRNLQGNRERMIRESESLLELYQTIVKTESSESAIGVINGIIEGKDKGNYHVQ